MNVRLNRTILGLVVAASSFGAGAYLRSAAVAHEVTPKSVVGQAESAPDQPRPPYADSTGRLIRSNVPNLTPVAGPTGSIVGYMKPADLYNAPMGSEEATSPVYDSTGTLVVGYMTENGFSAGSATSSSTEGEPGN